MKEKGLIDFSLYLITDRKLFADEEALFIAITKALEGGAKAVQLREKDLPVRDMLALAYRMSVLTKRYQAKLFVNDRVDVALCVQADGVHLGLSSLPVTAVRKAAGSSLMIGVSTHSLEEAVRAERDGADFITFGPVYETPSKLRYGAPVGVKALQEASTSVSIPVFGIGGITPGKVQEVSAAGAWGVAVIRGVWAASDISHAVRAYLN